MIQRRTSEDTSNVHVKTLNLYFGVISEETIGVGVNYCLNVEEIKLKPFLITISRTFFPNISDYLTIK